MVLALCSIASASLNITDINGNVFEFEIARTPEERARGLSGREHLPLNQGMVFIFEEPKILRFWMKDTSLFLNIAFLSDAGQVLQIESMTPYSLKSVVSEQPCRLAFEANTASFDTLGIRVGDTLPLSYDVVCNLYDSGKPDR